jgi:hypothetical protein
MSGEMEDMDDDAESEGLEEMEEEEEEEQERAPMSDEVLSTKATKKVHFPFLFFPKSVDDAHFVLFPLLKIRPLRHRNQHNPFSPKKRRF